MQIPGVCRSHRVFSYFFFFLINCYLGGRLVHILILFFNWLQAKCLLLDSNFIANNLKKENGFLDLNLSITNGIVSSKIYDKRYDFNFEIVNFPFLDEDVPRSPSYGVYISQLIRFARVCSNVDDFNNRNLFLTAKLLKQGYRYKKNSKSIF